MKGGHSHLSPLPWPSTQDEIGSGGDIGGEAADDPWWLEGRARQSRRQHGCARGEAHGHGGVCVVPGSRERMRGSDTKSTYVRGDLRSIAWGIGECGDCGFPFVERR